MSDNNRIEDAGSVSALNFGSRPACAKAFSASYPLLR